MPVILKKVQSLLLQLTDILSKNYPRAETIDKAMQLLLDYSEVCRVYYFELTPSSEHEYLASQLFEVCAPGIEEQIDNPELQNVPLLPYFESWLHAFKKNEPYYGDIADLPDGEREILEVQGIVSIIVLPVFWDKKLVGFIGFDETKEKRQWTRYDVEILNKSSRLLGRLLSAHSVDLALERKNEHFRHLVESMPVGCIELNSSGIILSWNSSASRIFGYSEEEVFGRPISMLTNGNPLVATELYENGGTADTTSDAPPSEEEQIVGNESATWHDAVKLLQAKRKDNSFVAVRWRIRYVKDSLGELARFIILAEDITQELEQSEAIRKSEELFRNLYERMNDGVVYQDAKGKILRANMAACRLLGLNYEQLMGRESFDPRWEATKENGQPFPGEEHPAMVALEKGVYIENVVMGIYSPLETNRRWISINATPEYRDGEEKPYRVFTIFRDVTDSIELKKKLEMSQAKFLAYASTITIGVWFRDEEFNLTFVNDSLSNIFGITKEELFKNNGQKYEDFVHPDDRDLVMTMHKRHIEKLENVSFEFRIIRPDGVERCVQVKEIYIATPFSEILTSAGYMSDITDQKVKMETLTSAKATAESLSKLRMSIIEAISHEFRTPITSIMGFSTLIQNMLEDEELIKYASLVQESADRLYQSLESILCYASLISEQSTVRPRHLNLKAILSDILQRTSIQAQEKGLYFQQFIPENLIIYSDETIIKSIVEQLLENAVKFTAEGGFRLHVKAVKNKLFIEVVDTGIGISDEVSLAVFEPFRQGSEGISRLYNGTGMGLPIVFKQVELLKGTMNYHNNELGGLTLNIVIPIEIESNMTFSRDEKPGIQNVSDLRILYVEDDPLLQLLMKKSLKEFDITVVTTPDEAISKISENSYNVFLLDINLNHQLNGIDICNLIRKHEAQKEAYIIAVTAQSKDLLEPYMGANGFNAYFTKPFNHNSLRETILKHYSLVF